MKSILLIEDDEAIRDTFAEILRDEGYEVHLAADGKEGLDVLQSLEPKPCLVLTNMMMPIMSGEQLMKALRDTDMLAAAPVVVMSAQSDASVPPGAQRFIRKPVSCALLLALVQEFCGRP